MSALVEVMPRPRSRAAAVAVDILLVVLGSAVVALAAQVSVRLPFTPVPISGQTLAVLLVGASLGAVRGGSALLLYLAEGAAGMPVFAEAKSGFLYLTSADPLHTTGGYLWGFVLAAVVVGALAQRRWDRSVGSALGAMLVGLIVIFTCGVLWLAAALDVSIEQAMTFGLYPFVVGDVIKLLIAAAVLPAAWGFVGRLRDGDDQGSSGTS